MKTEARFFKSLADETRLQILWLLSGAEEFCVCDVIALLGITQSKASRHLRYLYHLGWVMDRREGLWMNYRSSRDPWQRQRETAPTPGGNVGAPARSPGYYGAIWHVVWRTNGTANAKRLSASRTGVVAGFLKPKNFALYT